MESIQELCCVYVATLRAIGLLYKNYHWLASGDNFYGNHLLFDRLYETILKDIDLFAEKSVGLFGDKCLNISLQSDIIAKCLKQSAGGEAVPTLIDAERKFLTLSEHLYKTIDEEGEMTQGLDDLILKIADDREEALYLLGRVQKNSKMAARREKILELNKN